MSKKLEGWFSCENMPKEPIKIEPCRHVDRTKAENRLNEYFSKAIKTDYTLFKSNYETIKRITNN